MARPLSIDVLKLPPVDGDKPTSAAPAPAAAPASRPAEPVSLPSVEEALASKDRAINNRVAGELWDLVAARADELGVKLRPILTDALVRALEQDPETHRASVQATEQRQAIARITNRR